MFPLYMLVVALSTLVASGMSSILPRQLGAWRVDDARATFAAAHGLAAVMGLMLMQRSVGFGKPVALLAAGGSEALAEMGLTYLRITVFAAPLIFILSVNSDPLHNEGLYLKMPTATLGRSGTETPYGTLIPCRQMDYGRSAGRRRYWQRSSLFVRASGTR